MSILSCTGLACAGFCHGLCFRSPDLPPTRRACGPSAELLAWRAMGGEFPDEGSDTPLPALPSNTEASPEAPPRRLLEHDSPRTARRRVSFADEVVEPRCSGCMSGRLSSTYELLAPSSHTHTLSHSTRTQPAASEDTIIELNRMACRESFAGGVHACLSLSGLAA